jgi:hypothetical protein
MRPTATGQDALSKMVDQQAHPGVLSDPLSGWGGVAAGGGRDPGGRPAGHALFLHGPESFGGTMEAST